MIEATTRHDKDGSATTTELERQTETDKRTRCSFLFLVGSCVGGLDSSFKIKTHKIKKDVNQSQHTHTQTNKQTDSHGSLRAMVPKCYLDGWVCCSCRFKQRTRCNTGFGGGGGGLFSFSLARTQKPNTSKQASKRNETNTQHTHTLLFCCVRRTHKQKGCVQVHKHEKKQNTTLAHTKKQTNKPHPNDRKRKAREERLPRANDTNTKHTKPAQSNRNQTKTINKKQKAKQMCGGSRTTHRGEDTNQTTKHKQTQERDRTTRHKPGRAAPSCSGELQREYTTNRHKQTLCCCHTHRQTQKQTNKHKNLLCFLLSSLLSTTHSWVTTKELNKPTPPTHTTGTNRQNKPTKRTLK